jgi:hypothetical protein
MNKLNKVIAFGASIWHGKTVRLIILALTIAIFVLAAGAPSATIGIGK